MNWIRFENDQFFFLQHFWMLQNVALVWPAPSQHLTTRSNDVARVKILLAHGRAFTMPLKRGIHNHRLPLGASLFITNRKSIISKILLKK